MKVLKLKQKNLRNVVKTAKKLIKAGKVIICPTDTVYIPAADATNRKAVRKVFLIKNRPLANPLPIFVKDIKTAKKLAEINREQEKFLKRVWPGRVTVVVMRKKTKMKLYGIDKRTIALRIPNYKLVNILLEKLNRPLVGTSANISGKPASGNLKEVLRQLKKGKHQPDLIIDAGILPGKPSKVIDLMVLPPKILRL